MEKGKKITLLAIAGHPDDASFEAGGTIAKYAKAGHNCWILNVTRGGGGSLRYNEEELEKIRTIEGEKEAKVLGAQVKFLDLKDGWVLRTLENRLKIVDAIREIKPDIILSHHPYELHPDEYSIGRMVVDAYCIAAVPNVKTEHGPWSIKYIYFYADPHRFDWFVRAIATHAIDITDTIEIKMEALRQHKSQHEWMREHDGYDAFFVEEEGAAEPWGIRRHMARVVGAEFGCLYAEPFVILRNKACDFFPYP